MLNSALFGLALSASLSFVYVVEAAVPIIRDTSESSYARSMIPRSQNSTSATHPPCRNMPGDPSFPTEKDWNDLNKTVGGRLISGVPLAKICYGATDNQAACSKLQQQWPTVDP